MTNDLLPCPFCGGEATTDCSDWWFVGCVNSECREFFGTSFKRYNTEAEAISAWNTRAVREYRITDYRGGYGMCDHCGAWVSGVAWTDCTENHKVWHCPNCGREIVRQPCRCSVRKWRGLNDEL